MIKKLFYKTLAALLIPFMLILAILTSLHSQLITKSIKYVFAIGVRIKVRLYMKTLLDIQHRMQTTAHYIAEEHIKLASTNVSKKKSK